MPDVLEECHDVVSVVVPVYNIAEFLPVCVDSLLAQAYRNIEIVLVDDGSTDGSSALCDSLAKRDGRIRVCHQVNRGLSGARNTGTELASGDWIVYVDGDDVVAPTFVSALLGAALRLGVEVACCLPVIAGESSVLAGGLTFTGHSSSLANLLGAKAATAELLAEGRASTSAWAKLAHSSLWRRFSFPEGRKYEDMPVTWKLFAASGGVAVLEDKLYGYVMRTTSITHVPSMASMRDYDTSICQMYQETGSQPWGEELVGERSFRACLEYSRLLELLVQVMNADGNGEEGTGILYRKALGFIRMHVSEALRSRPSSRAQKARLLLTACAPRLSAAINAALSKRKG